ncbi:MAG: Cof-type HAD-IIB family hydrolase [Clostridia bacterium]|nr:Cof-type HAD-IIB family hydrolase [Clostridia bacterium]
MEIKIIATDLDGTLLNEHSALSEYTQAVFTAAAQKGIKIVVATGRPYGALPACVKDFAYFDYAITSNGAAVYDMQNGTLLKSHTMRAESVRALSDYALLHAFGLEFVSGGKAYGEKYYFEHPEHFGFSRHSLEYLYSTRTKIEDLNAFLKEYAHSVESMHFVLKEERSKPKIIAHFCKDTSLYITSSHPLFAEFSSKECGKANALRFILEKEGLSQAQLAAFGNAQNDLEMIEMAQIGAVTADSAPEVLARAAHRCAPCRQDGVAAFVEKEILNR